MLTELGKRIDEHSENYNKELENPNKETDIQVQEAQRDSNKMNPETHTKTYD